MAVSLQSFTDSVNKTLTYFNCTSDDSSPHNSFDKKKIFFAHGLLGSGADYENTPLCQNLQPGEETILPNGPDRRWNSSSVRTLGELVEYTKSSVANFGGGHSLGGYAISTVSCLFGNAFNKSAIYSSSTALSGCAPDISTSFEVTHRSPDGIVPENGGTGLLGALVGSMPSQADFTRSLAAMIGCNTDNSQQTTGTVDGNPANITIYNNGCNGGASVVHTEIQTSESARDAHRMTSEQISSFMEMVRSGANNTISNILSNPPSSSPTAQDFSQSKDDEGTNPAVIAIATVAAVVGVGIACAAYMHHRKKSGQHAARLAGGLVADGNEVARAV